MTHPDTDKQANLQELARFIYDSGLAPVNSALDWTPLAGGISSNIWRVDTVNGSLCIKQALEKLNVAADWHAPLSRNTFEWEWLRFAKQHAPGNVPDLLAHDEQKGVFAMAFLDMDSYPVWKKQLMAGTIEPETARALGQVLSQLHRASANNASLAARFDSTDNFYALRLAPYFLSMITKYSEYEETLQELVKNTADTRTTLVHGDISPKNILVAPDGEPVILDAECAWYGDPAFDTAFLLNHLLLKCLVNPKQHKSYLDCFDSFWESYLANCDWESRTELERRTAVLLPALLLARVDGKSPVEYLTTDLEKNLVRKVACKFLQSPNANLSTLKANWCRHVEEYRASILSVSLS